MFDYNYKYVERPAGAILGRRGFFKVVGACLLCITSTAWGLHHIFTRRNRVLSMRQEGLYKDDKLCQKMGLARSHENPVIMQIYKDLNAQPMDNTVYQFLHTHYYQRTRLAAYSQGDHH